jgi:ParB-like nuclease domain
LSKTISSNALLGVLDDIPISKIRALKSHLRPYGQNFDDLVESIRHRGLLQPTVVRDLGMVIFMRSSQGIEDTRHARDYLGGRSLATLSNWRIKKHSKFHLLRTFREKH